MENTPNLVRNPYEVREGITILAVDDDALYRETVVNYGKKLGYNFIDANCGNDAFKIIQSQPIHGLLTDLRMANGTGIELMKRIRNSKKELPIVPKIIVNTGLLEGGEKYLKSLGAIQIFIKPVDIKLVVGSLIELARS